MNPEVVRALEDKIEEAVAAVLKEMGRKRLPLVPSRPTCHMMAKAAVAVYEAAVENRRSEDES